MTFIINIFKQLFQANMISIHCFTLLLDGLMNWWSDELKSKRGGWSLGPLPKCLAGLHLCVPDAHDSGEPILPDLLSSCLLVPCSVWQTNWTSIPEPVRRLPAKKQRVQRTSWATGTPHNTWLQFGSNNNISELLCKTFINPSSPISKAIDRLMLSSIFAITCMSVAYVLAASADWRFLKKCVTAEVCFTPNESPLSAPRLHENINK